jgi:predicted ATPase
MKIQEIKIRNFKSIISADIILPNQFSVFVGSNASGKSNIFEALNFLVCFEKNSLDEVERLFGGLSTFANRGWYNNQNNYTHLDDYSTDKENLFFDDPLYSLGIEFNLTKEITPYVYYYKPIENKDSEYDNGDPAYGFRMKYLSLKNSQSYKNEFKPGVLKKIESNTFKQFIEGHSRIFVKNKEVEKTVYNDDKRLSTACGNLEKVLKRILKDEIIREEIIEWLQLLIPGFENLEIKSEELSGTDNLLIYEKGNNKPFPAHLISDGTFNIIALLTAVYQSEEPQFLCIEEPENGLNPKVVKELIGFFREQCKKKGHYIWLNTHSQTLVRELTTEEIIIIDKIDGETKIKQIQGMNLHGLKMDEALFTNAIGGGIPW